MQNFWNKFKKWIIGLLIGGAVLAGGGEIINQPTEEVIQLQEVQLPIVGYTFGLMYKNNSTGEIEEFECTKEEYEDVSMRDAQPIKDGYTFVGGYGGKAKYSASVPTLEDNQFVNLHDGTKIGEDTVIIKLPGKSISEQNIKNLSRDNTINSSLIE